jgi:hypothetical protein
MSRNKKCIAVSYQGRNPASWRHSTQNSAAGYQRGMNPANQPVYKTGWIHSSNHILNPQNIPKHPHFSEPVMSQRPTFNGNQLATDSALRIAACDFPVSLPDEESRFFYVCLFACDSNVVHIRFVAANIMQHSQRKTKVGRPTKYSLKLMRSIADKVGKGMKFYEAASRLIWVRKRVQQLLNFGYFFDSARG